MSAPVNAFQTALTERWAALASRERMLVGSAVALIAMALVWWVGLSPALSKIGQARLQAPQLEAQLQLMRAQAQEAASLKGQRQLSYDESLRSLEASIKTLGLGATLSVQQGRASVVVKGSSGDALAQWLAQVRANARLVPTELRLQRSATASPSAAVLWDGSIVLALPAR